MKDEERKWTPVILPAEFRPPVGAYSPAVRAGNFIFVSGQVPKDPRTAELVGATIQQQARAVLDNLARVLAAAGASLADVVTVTVYLADMNDWDAFNEVYRATFSRPFPSRTTVGAELRGFLVEISAIAYVAGS